MLAYRESKHRAREGYSGASWGGVENRHHKCGNVKELMQKYI